MTVGQKALPKWILIVSGIFAVLELLVSIAICTAPASVLESVDFTAKGVTYLAYMWAAGKPRWVSFLRMLLLSDRFRC